jgi:hypothetical protein
MKRPYPHLPNAGTCEGEAFFMPQAGSLKPQAASSKLYAQCSMLYALCPESQTKNLIL